MPTPSRYWREIPQRYRLEAAKCSSCGFICFPPRVICPKCGGREFSPTTLAEKGTLLTYTVIRVAPSAYTDQAPYPVALVELTDGNQIMCQVVDCDPEQVEIGMPVQLEFRKILSDGEAGMLAYGYKAVPKR